MAGAGPTRTHRDGGSLSAKLTQPPSQQAGVLSCRDAALLTDGRLLAPCCQHLCGRHFSNHTCSLRVSGSHFGNSPNISKLDSLFGSLHSSVSRDLRCSCCSGFRPRRTTPMEDHELHQCRVRPDGSPHRPFPHPPPLLGPPWSLRHNSVGIRPVREACGGR